jgi:quercetin 2,3-dioxygenase
VSGPMERADLECEDRILARIEAREGRATTVGGLDVARVLPTKGRRTVGAWCFVDLIGPADAEDPDPLEIGPHPHIGLATVTWLLEGEALHSDSLGTEQVIRPGQLNLMTAGHGIAHAELAARPPFRGVQLWVAQPERTRHGPSAFEHHGELPRVELEHGDALVLVGEVAGAEAPTRADTPLVGADLTLGRGVTPFPARAAHEHAVVPIDGRVRVGPEVIEPGWIGLVPAGLDELPIETERETSRLLVLGGEPLGERVEMWWNFVARDRTEIEDAYHDWTARTDRFATVPSALERIEAPRPPWLPSED